MNIWADRRLIIGPYLGLCTTEAMFKRELKRLSLPTHDWPEFVPEWADASVHHIEHKGRPTCIVCIRGHETRTGIEIAGLLVHEAVHVWQNFCRSIGERDPSLEFEAYSIQAIAQELMKLFHAQTGGKA